MPLSTHWGLIDRGLTMSDLLWSTRAHGSPTTTGFGSQKPASGAVRGLLKMESLPAVADRKLPSHA